MRAGREIIIFGKDGSLKTDNAYEAISLEASQYRIGGLPYFLKVPNVREIISCMERLCDITAYVIWNIVLYFAGYGETLVGNDKRRLAASELEQIERYLWNLPSGTSRKKNTCIERSGESSF